jgi:hypothetical protein
LGFRADLLVAETFILEIKAVPALLPAHEAQLPTYLRMSGLSVGLLMNSHATRLKSGLKCFVATWFTLPQRPFAALLRPPCWKWRQIERTRWCRRPQGRARPADSPLTGGLPVGNQAVMVTRRNQLAKAKKSPQGD